MISKVCLVFFGVGGEGGGGQSKSMSTAECGCWGSHTYACGECRGHHGHTSVLPDNSHARHTSTTRTSLPHKLIQTLIRFFFFNKTRDQDAGRR